MLSHKFNRRACLSSVASITFGSLAWGSTAKQNTQQSTSEARPPRNDEDLRAWLENMVGAHRFTVAEVHAATGLDPDAIRAALNRFRIEPGKLPTRAPS